MANLPISLSVPTKTPNLSFSTHFSNHFLTSRFTHLSISKPPKPTIIRMGGGPRTYPGGVSKWQWKRMQAKKAKQLLRARLARERQIYEMRKRAELKAAISELERPWEVVEKAPRLFSASADEQVKVLADRFQKPGGFDLWSENDGPQLFGTLEKVPTARFFPKGVVHSIKPYQEIADCISEEESNKGFEEKLELQRNGTYDKNSRNVRGETATTNECENATSSSKGKFRKNVNGNRRRALISDSGNSNQFDREESCRNPRKDNSSEKIRRGNGSKVPKHLNSLVFDMSLQNDGSYGFSNGEMDIANRRRAEGN